MRNPYIIIAIPTHNQNIQVNQCLYRISKQTVLPNNVIIIDDYSDPPFELDSNIDLGDFAHRVKIFKKDKGQGRSSTRNTGFHIALKYLADIVIFMDGDSAPIGTDFVANYLKHFEDKLPKAVYGTRIHVPSNSDYDKLKEIWDESELFKYAEKTYTSFDRMPSDFINNNALKIACNKELNWQDIRAYSNIMADFAKPMTFAEKTDFILSGMITWSCNFAINKAGLMILYKHMLEIYGLQDQIFDECEFRNQWGYEDIAMGLDAHYAGLEIELKPDISTMHIMHGKLDDPMVYIRGQHLIMNRFRKLEKLDARSNISLPVAITADQHSIDIDGSSFPRKKKDYILIANDLSQVNYGKSIIKLKNGFIPKKLSIFKQITMWILCRIITF